VSRLPQLEAQLVTAAARRPRPRAPRRIAIGLAAAACAAALVLQFAPRREDQVPATAPPGVPAQTLALSHALTAAPAPSRDARHPIPHLELPAVAAALEARTPYPPGVRDGFDWAATPADPQSMASIDFHADVQSLVEYRSYCLWLKYWLAGEDTAGAAAVIADVPRWPTRRQTDPYELEVQARIQAAVRDGDVAPIQREVALNCRGL
jgi:hypothetical protein